MIDYKTLSSKTLDWFRMNDEIESNVYDYELENDRNIKESINILITIKI